MKHWNGTVAYEKIKFEKSRIIHRTSHNMVACQFSTSNFGTDAYSTTQFNADTLQPNLTKQNVNILDMHTGK
jgi:hypothetical protein